MNPLEPIDIAVAWALTQIHTGLGAIVGPASGWAWAGSIVILVVLMRLVLVPLFVKQLHATRKMSALAPQIQELKKRYKNDKQKLNEETMKLYKENGANPLAGCLPLVAQFPLFFALFDVLEAISSWKPGHGAVYGMPASVVESAQHARIFGATVSDRFLTKLFPPTLDNIAHSSQIVIFIFVAVSATTTFMTVRQSTKRGMNPQMTPDNPMAGMQKYMAYIAPVFALSGLYWQFGLVLYWVTTNLWTLGQQYFLFKRYPMQPQGQAAGGAQGVVVGTAPTVVAGKRAPSPGVNGARNRGKAVGGAGRTATGPAGGPSGRVSPPKQAPASQAGAKQAAPGEAAAENGGAEAAAPKQAPASQAGAEQAAPKEAAAKQAPARQAGAKGAPPKQAPSKAAPSKAAPPKPAGKRAGPAGGSKKPGGTSPGTNGSGGSGVLRRLGRSRPEPEPEPAAPEVKLIRQQRVRQSRSKRSGKR